MTVRVLKFENIQGDWFVDLPQYIEYGGDYADLQMVLGADEMLDVIAENEEVVSLVISTHEMEDSVTLTRGSAESGGHWYHLVDERYPDKIWLCAVTYFIFGEFPLHLYFKRHE